MVAVLSCANLKVELVCWPATGFWCMCQIMSKDILSSSDSSFSGPSCIFMYWWKKCKSLSISVIIIFVDGIISLPSLGGIISLFALFFLLVRFVSFFLALLELSLLE